MFEQVIYSISFLLISIFLRSVSRVPPQDKLINNYSIRLYISFESFSKLNVTINFNIYMNIKSKSLINKMI